MARLRLTYADRGPEEFDASPVVSILVAAQRAGAPLRHDCGGKALCGTCRVRVSTGTLSPVSERERARLDAAGAGAGERLACQARAGSDLTLEAVLPLAVLPLAVLPLAVLPSAGGVGGEGLGGKELP